MLGLRYPALMAEESKHIFVVKVLPPSHLALLRRIMIIPVYNVSVCAEVLRGPDLCSESAHSIAPSLAGANHIFTNYIRSHLDI